jgi:hypothetical protein
MPQTPFRILIESRHPKGNEQSPLDMLGDSFKTLFPGAQIDYFQDRSTLPEILRLNKYDWIVLNGDVQRLQLKELVSKCLTDPVIGYL